MCMCTYWSVVPKGGRKRFFRTEDKARAYAAGFASAAVNPPTKPARK